MKTVRVSTAWEPRADQVSVARKWVAESCTGMDDERVQVAELLVSELMTRALQHRPRTVRLVARKGPEDLPVDVREENPPSTPEPRAVRYREPPSMANLACLASTWGEKMAARSRTVWFTLRDTSKACGQGPAPESSSGDDRTVG